ncbi:MAG: hypothetical protein KBG48_23470 [Kofleriaceae bacterium]|nr:hypothetical protein [Kofleriaceae bacterium]MBP9170386.1 hypothetical protein [Kofleriaceae bacterium]MBP9860052.1 hypothetical protein [Kofleriaceae bacterium]
MKRSRLAKVLSASMLILAGCSAPSGGGADDDDDDDVRVDAAVDSALCANPVPEVCGNTLDDDCDGIADCDDADCSDACNNANCGQAQIGGTLALPDNDCSEDLSVPCPGYENPINITGFNPGQTLTSGNGILGICLNIEHSWMRDIIIYAQCPNGTRVMMSQFEGRNGGEVFLGQPNDDDEFGAPVPGVGYDYCWVPGAANLPWIPYANANPVSTLPAGDYQASQSWDAFVGCPLNGEWKLRVEDRWSIDNGFIFNWQVKFDPNLVPDCANWPG